MKSIQLKFSQFNVENCTIVTIHQLNRGKIALEYFVYLLTVPESYRYILKKMKDFTSPIEKLNNFYKLGH